MSFYVGDYIADTMHLSQGQHGAYLLLICHYWNRGPIPSKHCFSIARANDEQERSNVEQVLEEFFDREGAVWIHKRIDQERQRAAEKHAKRVSAGKIGGLASGKSRAAPTDAKAKRKRSRSNASALLDQSQPQPQSISEGVSPLLLGSEGDVSLPPEDNPSQTKALVEPLPTVLTWERYAAAYKRRYNVDPVRNAQTNGQLANLVARLGKDEAPAVAEFYVQHNNRLYVAALHTVMLLLRDAESLRTQWARGQAVTSIEAAQVERTQANSNAFAPMLAEAQQRERLANG